MVVIAVIVAIDIIGEMSVVVIDVIVVVRIIAVIIVELAV